MKQVFVIIMVISVMLCLTTNAQDQSTRFEKQHKSKFLKSNIKNTEETLLNSFESNHLEVISTSIQTLRQLEDIFPDNNFSSLLDPLIKFVKDENMDTQVRILSALALEALHSDKGDNAIYEIAKSSNNKSVQDICITLSTESLKSDLTNK